MALAWCIIDGKRKPPPSLFLLTLAAPPSSLTASCTDDFHFTPCTATSYPRRSLSVRAHAHAFACVHRQLAREEALGSPQSGPLRAEGRWQAGLREPRRQVCTTRRDNTHAAGSSRLLLLMTGLWHASFCIHALPTGSFISKSIEHTHSLRDSSCTKPSGGKDDHLWMEDKGGPTFFISSFESHGIHLDLQSYPKRFTFFSSAEWSPIIIFCLVQRWVVSRVAK